MLLQGSLGYVGLRWVLETLAHPFKRVTVGMMGKQGQLLQHHTSSILKEKSFDNSNIHQRRSWTTKQFNF